MDKNIIKDFTCNGKCSSCGQCCSDILPISKNEIKNIKNYIDKHKIKECKHQTIFDNKLDLTCPFRDNEKKICTIYAVRPDICKCFICSKPQPDIERDRNLFYAKKSAESMRNIFFGGESLNSIFMKLLNNINMEN